jgi:uncharacterized protein (TIGR02996 family)
MDAFCSAPKFEMDSNSREVWSMSSKIPETRDRLEQEVLENPDDISCHIALADWLSERGDPLGEFIRLQLELEAQDLPADIREARCRREQELLTARERTWLGGLAEPLLRQKAYFFQRGLGPNYRPYQFRRGWLYRLAIDGSWFGPVDDWAARKISFDAYQHARALEYADFMRALSTAAGARLIEQLFLYSFVTDRSSALPGAYPSLRQVTSLALGDDADPRGSGLDEGALAMPLIGSMPRLADIFLWLPDLDPAPLCALPSLEGLRSLRICLGNAPRADLWPRALAGSRHLHNLSDLTFCHVEWKGFCDILCEELVRSRMLRQLCGLKTLSLDCVTDQGIRTLAGCPELLGLRKLAIASGVDLSDEGVGRLRAAGVNVAFDDEDRHGQD